MGEQTMSHHSVVMVAKDQVSADLGGEMAILNLKNGVYYGLNEIGAKIWNLIQAPRKVSEIRDAILEQYEVEPERCERDLLAILQKLLDAGLIAVKNEENT